MKGGFNFKRKKKNDNLGKPRWGSATQKASVMTERAFKDTFWHDEPSVGKKIDAVFDIISERVNCHIGLLSAGTIAVNCIVR